MAGPTIIGSTPLRDTLLGLSMPLDGLRVESQGGSFAWLSGQSVTSLSISDPAGNPLFSAESVAVDRSLVDLAFGAVWEHPTDRGTSDTFCDDSQQREQH